MNTLLSFMDKIYSDTKTLSMIYVIGAVLLFIFIILLVVSLRKPDKKEETKIIEEPKIDEEPKEENIEESKIEEVKQEDETVEKEKSLDQSIFEKTVIIPISELEKENTIEKALNNVEQTEKNQETEIEEPINVSSDIPNVDDFVDNVVKKTYEKNEQFSSIYVGNNTSTIKLDKVMENLNVDESVKENIVPEEEKTEVKEEIIVEEPKEAIIEEPIVDEHPSESTEEPKENSLDALKKALDEKKQEITLKQDDLKAKLESLKKDN